MNNLKSLTRYPIGSIREMWRLAFPLMLMTLSTYLMMFADRLVVSWISPEAMSALSLSGMSVRIFYAGFTSLALIAEVFVGQYNGSKQFTKLSQPVWQMIWFALFSAAIYFPFAFFAGELFIQQDLLDLGYPYYKLLMIFGPLAGMIAALSSFYIGRGKATLITVVVIFGNLINIALNVFLVFGIKGLIDPMGVVGAAWATVIAQIIQFSILFYLFLRPKNRTNYKTTNYALNWQSMKSCLKVGLPNSISLSILLISLQLFYKMIANSGMIHIATLSLASGYFYLAMFITDGIGKSVTALSANLIGSNQAHLIPKVMRSGIYLLGIFAIILSVPLVFWSEPFIEIFTPKHQLQIEGLHAMADSALTWTWWAFIFNSLGWIFMCQLTAAGDTKYTMCANTATGWICLILPTYLLVNIFDYSPQITWKVMVFNHIALAVLMIHRFHSGKWRDRKII